MITYGGWTPPPATKLHGLGPLPFGLREGKQGFIRLFKSVHRGRNDADSFLPFSPLRFILFLPAGTVQFVAPVKQRSAEPGKNYQ